MVTEKVIFEQAVWGWLRVVSLIAEAAKIRLFQQGLGRKRL